MFAVHEQDSVTGLGWALVAVAVVLTGCRYVVRMRRVGGLQLDDVLHGVALLGSIAYMGIDTVQLRLPYYSKADMVYYERLAVSASILGFVCVLYLVKFAFLIMFRSIFRVSPGFMWWWKAVCVLTGVSLLAAFLSYFWICGSPYQTVNPQFCSPILPSQARVVEIMIVVCVLNSVSSIAVMVLPMCMLHSLQVRPAEKCGLAAVFLLAIVDMVCDIVRTVATLKVMSSVLGPIATIEPPVAVIVSALAALGPGLQRRAQRQKASPSPAAWSGSHPKSGSGGRQPAGFDSESPLEDGPTLQTLPRMRHADNVRTVITQGYIDSVYVQHDYEKECRVDKTLPPTPTSRVHTPARPPGDVTSRYNSYYSTRW